MKGARVGASVEINFDVPTQVERNRAQIGLDGVFAYVCRTRSLVSWCGGFFRENFLDGLS